MCHNGVTRVATRPTRPHTCTTSTLVVLLHCFSTMPEYTEALASTLTIQRWFDVIRSQKLLTVQSIWIDATGKDQKHKDFTSARGRDGHVFPLTPAELHTISPRGSRGAQRPIYPPDPRMPSQYLQSLDVLQLKNVFATPRTVILDLDQLFFQIQLHTHVMPQPYTRAQWDEEISQVDSETSGKTSCANMGNTVE
ncbi:hypothetical protein BKA93DRAFT_782697 [Sparassis latifolia]